MELYEKSINAEISIIPDMGVIKILKIFKTGINLINFDFKFLHRKQNI